MAESVELADVVARVGSAEAVEPLASAATAGSLLAGGTSPGLEQPNRFSTTTSVVAAAARLQWLDRIKFAITFIPSPPELHDLILGGVC
jgi:hypothetical protein